MLGNILFVTSFIFYGMLTYLLLNPKPGGDAVVGYSFALLIYGAGFIVATGLLVWNMSVHQCFDWLSMPFLRYRNWLIFFGWIVFVVTILWSLDYHYKWIEGEFLEFIRWFALSKVFIWLPLLILIPTLYLINAQRLADFAPMWVKIPIQTGFSVSF